jgi:hypothetical protein
MKKIFFILMILFCPHILWAGSSNWDSLMWDQDVWYAGDGTASLSVMPSNQNVSGSSGTTAFSVANTGTGTIKWDASVTSGSWLTITSGTSGTNSGTVNCSFTANIGTTSRTANIRVIATGATGSPKDVTVTQASTLTPTPSPTPTPTPTPTSTPTPKPTPTPTPTPKPTPTPTPTPTICTAAIDGDLLFHIPSLSYINPMLGTISLWADLLYEFNPTHSTLILFKYLNSGINNPSYSCAGSTLSADLKIHIPDVLVPDGSTHLWVDLEYTEALSTGGNAYFVVTKYGVNAN